MKVTLIASTDLDTVYAEKVTDYVWDLDWEETPVDGLAEFAGRACYQSWDKPNPATSSNEGYLANIINQRHESVLAHASATFYVEGVSRALTAELIRSRFLVFSEMSQRYVDMSDAECVSPKVFGAAMRKVQQEHWEGSKRLYDLAVKILENEGVKGKKAREAARYFLPIGAETKIVVSGNIRAWRDFIKQRMTPDAMEEIRDFATEVYNQLNEIAPNSMQGIEEIK